MYYNGVWKMEKRKSENVRQSENGVVGEIIAVMFVVGQRWRSMESGFFRFGRWWGRKLMGKERLRL